MSESNVTAAALEAALLNTLGAFAAIFDAIVVSCAEQHCLTLCIRIVFIRSR